MIVLLTATLTLLLSPAQNLPVHSTPIRNTFVVATETVIDDASKIDPRSNDPITDSQFQELNKAKATLAGMADDEREKEVVSATSDMIFAITACHLQGRNGISTEKCQVQFDHARTRVMEAIGKHKAADAWVDGPPA